MSGMVRDSSLSALPDKKPSEKCGWQNMPTYSHTSMPSEKGQPQAASIFRNQPSDWIAGYQPSLRLFLTWIKFSSLHMLGKMSEHRATKDRQKEVRDSFESSL